MWTLITVRASVSGSFDRRANLRNMTSSPAYQVPQTRPGIRRTRLHCPQVPRIPPLCTSFIVRVHYSPSPSSRSCNCPAITALVRNFLRVCSLCIPLWKHSILGSTHPSPFPHIFVLRVLLPPLLFFHGVCFIQCLSSQFVFLSYR